MYKKKYKIIYSLIKIDIILYFIKDRLKEIKKIYIFFCQTIIRFIQELDG